MNRRQLISLTGVIGVSGCLRLQSEGGENGDAVEQSEGEENGDAVEQSEGEENGDAGDTESTVTLVESVSVDRGIYQIWNYNGNFITNSNTGATNITTSGRVLWEYNKPPENEHNAVNAYAIDDQIAIFGFTGDPNAEEPASEAGAQYHGLNYGSEQWVTEFPSDGNHRDATGVAIGDTTAIVAADDFGSQSEQSPLVYGIEISSGEQLWEIGTAELPGKFISGVLFYDGQAFIFHPDGAIKVDPNSGSIIDQLEIGVGTMGPPNQVQDSIYYYSRGRVQSYSLSDKSVNWTIEDIERPNIQPIVDNSLVIVGTQSGDLYAIDRSTGDTIWSKSIRNSIQFITMTPSYVFVTDRQSGLYGFTRTTGERVHNSTREISGSDISFINGHLLIGGEQAIYTIEES